MEHEPKSPKNLSFVSLYVLVPCLNFPQGFGSITSSVASERRGQCGDEGQGAVDVGVDVGVVGVVFNVVGRVSWLTFII